MALEFTGFKPAGQRFLGALQRNNDREWFARNKETYETELRAPLAALVEEMDVRLAAFSPEIVGDPKRSLFRIHRDVRFSNDKSPYKTNVAANMSIRPPDQGEDQHTTPGVYLSCFRAGFVSPGWRVHTPPMSVKSVY